MEQANIERIFSALSEGLPPSRRRLFRAHFDYLIRRTEHDIGFLRHATGVDQNEAWKRLKLRLPILRYVFGRMTVTDDPWTFLQKMEQEIRRMPHNEVYCDSPKASVIGQIGENFLQRHGPQTPGFGNSGTASGNTA